MRYRAQYKSALETRVDYVEGNLNEAIARFDAAIAKSDARYEESRREFKEAMQQMEIRHQANFAELKSSLDKVVSKAESSRRWAIGAVITIAVAVIGFMLTVIGILLTNGFQV